MEHITTAEKNINCFSVYCIWLAIFLYFSCVVGCVHRSVTNGQQMEQRVSTNSIYLCVVLDWFSDSKKPFFLIQHLPCVRVMLTFLFFVFARIVTRTHSRTSLSQLVFMKPPTKCSEIMITSWAQRNVCNSVAWKR